MNNKDNPAAFPSDNVYANNGMSLLDYFAGQALPFFLQARHLKVPGMNLLDQSVGAAYDTAEAMLIERAKRLKNQ